MSFNGSGVFVVNSAGQPVVANTLITSAAFNAFTADAATGLSTCITKDGQTTVTANIPFAGFKLTGIGAATARTDAASLASIQDGTGVYVATVGGTADAITLTPSPAITAYAAGQLFSWIASGANTTAATLQVSGIASPKALTKNGSAALVANDILSGQLVSARYDGTRFQLVHTGFAFAPTGLITASGLTMNTSRMLGRTTVTPGAIEEITVTLPLTLSAGNLTAISASTVSPGVVELLTQAEYDAATDTTRAPTASLNRIALGTEQASTSGTAITFTGIPAGTRRITMMLLGVSTNGTSILQIQLGDAGGIETSGYLGGAASFQTSAAVSATGVTSGFQLSSGGFMSASGVIQGRIVFTLEDASDFTWVSSGVLWNSGDSQMYVNAGSKALSAELTQISLTTLNGTDAFDAGAINIQYER